MIARSGPVEPAAPEYAASAHNLRQIGFCGYVPILLEKSVATNGCPPAVRLRATGFDLPALDALYATPMLRNAYEVSRWSPGHQCCEPP